MADPAFAIRSGVRARFVAALLQREDLAGADALLCVTGQDGKYNAGSQSLVKYLCLGCSGADAEEPTIEGHEDVEDMVLLIRRDGADVYYPAVAAREVQPLLANWGFVNEATLPPEVADADTELSELFKVRAFIAMTEGARRVAVPLTPGWTKRSKGWATLTRAPATGPVDPMEVETWPLVQAYGLEEMRTGGFFSMQHPVTDATAAIRELLADVDAQFLQQVSTRALPALLTHWGAMLAQLDACPAASARLRLSEVDVGEPLLSFYEFALIPRAAAGYAPGPGRGARVLFGARTAGGAVDAASEEATPEQCGSVPGEPALHMVAEAEDASTGLRVARTYFLATGHVDARGGDGDEAHSGGGVWESKGEDVAAGAAGAAAGMDAAAGSPFTPSPALPPSSRTARYLLNLYGALLRAHAAAICRLAQDAEESAGVLTSAARAVFVRTLELLQSPRADPTAPDWCPVVSAGALPMRAEALAERVRVEVSVTDARGQEVPRGPTPPLAPGLPARRLHYVRTCLADVPAPDWLPGDHLPGEAAFMAAAAGATGVPSAATPLGDLVVGDTVAVVPRDWRRWEQLRLSQPGTVGALPASAVLTRAVPLARAWPAPGAEEAAAEHVRRLLADPRAAAEALRLGSPCGAQQERAVLVLEGGAVDAVACAVRLYSGGMVLSAPAGGVWPVSVAHDVEAFRVVRSEEAGDASLLVLLLRHPVTFAGIACMQPARAVSLLLPAASPLSACVAEALPGWRAELAERRAAQEGSAEAEEAGGEADALELRAVACGRLPDDEALGDARRALEAVWLHRVTHGRRPATVHPSMPLWRALCAAQQLQASSADAGAGGSELARLVEACTVDDSAAAACAAAAVHVATLCDALSTRPPGAAADRVPVTVLAGLPCSAARTAARELVEFSSSRFHWFVAAWSEEEEGWVDVDAVAGKLEDALRAIVAASQHQDAAGGRPSSRRRRARILLCLPPGMAAAAAACAIALSDPLRRTCYVASVVLCASAVGSWTDAAAQLLHPALLQQCASGWASTVLVTDGDEATEEAVATLRRRVLQANRRVTFVRTPGGLGGALGLSPADVEELVSLDSFWRADLARARPLALHALAWGLLPDDSGAPAVAAALRTRVLPLRAPALADEERLRRALAMLVACEAVQVPSALAHAAEAHAAVPPASSLAWAVEGVVLALPPGDELRPPRPLRVAAVNGRCFTHWDELAAPGEVPVLLLHCRPGAAVPEEAAAQLVARAAALLADCVPAALAERPLQTRESLTPAELQRISDAHADVPVPDSYCFDGRNYVDFAGTTSPYHPLIEEFVDEYLAVVNAEADAHNARVREMLDAALAARGK